MKYIRLTKEQLTELYPEFIKFLASQSIDKIKWDNIKKNNPELAEQELDIFSDLIWERALGRVKYIDHFSKNHVFLFHCLKDHFTSIVISVDDKSVNLLNQQGIDWLFKHLKSDVVQIKTGTKKIECNNRNSEIFSLIRKGGSISKGELFNKMRQII